MSRIAHALGREAALLQPTWPMVGAGAIAIGAGAAIGAGQAGAAYGVVALGSAFALGLANWRFSILLLVAYLPISGIPILIFFGDSSLPTLAKDLFFIIPAYAGFFAGHLAAGRRITFDEAPLLLIGLLGVIVLLQALNPALISPAVALVGIKVWLMYIPLLFLGYHLVRDLRDLHLLLGLLSVAALVPALIGIIEAALLNSGHTEVVYTAYGDAASSATQGFGIYQVGGIDFRRVPSTFSSGTQYYVFISSAIAISYAWWRGVLAGGRRAWVGASVFGLMVVAGLLSGARGALVFVPLLLVVLAALDRGGGAAGAISARIPSRLPHYLGLAALLLLIAGVFSGGPAAVARDIVGHGAQQFDAYFLSGLRTAAGVTKVGLGTGMDTIASRHVVDLTELFGGTGGIWQEGWWQKALLELGIGGLLIAAALLAAILAGGIGVHRRLADVRLRAVSAAIIALLLWGVVYNFKAQYIDIDPLNVYFWLLAGVLFKLPSLDRPPDP